MADFCKQCADELFPSIEVYDLQDLITEKQFKAGSVVAVLCEGCGYTFVNHKGECVSTQCPIHGEANGKAAAIPKG